MSDSSDDMEIYSGFCDEEELDIEDVVFELLERVDKLEKEIKKLKESKNTFSDVKIPTRKSIWDEVEPPEKDKK